MTTLIKLFTFWLVVSGLALLARGRVDPERR